jgi:hypothetical protein
MDIDMSGMTRMTGKQKEGVKQAAFELYRAGRISLEMVYQRGNSGMAGNFRAKS